MLPLKKPAQRPLMPTPRGEPPNDEDWNRKRFRIIILGAGFSRPAGYPLAYELWNEIRKRAAGTVFDQDLDRYLEFKTCWAPAARDTIDFEDFCKFLDVEHYLQLQGSKTWSLDGNKTTVLIKNLIGRILAECAPDRSAIPNLYLEFARRLEPDDVVVTFNYDDLLERALEEVGNPYRLFPTRFSKIKGAIAEVESWPNEVVVLKFHGSIDWFDRSGYGDLELMVSGQPGYRPPHPVFGPHGDKVERVKLVDGPRFSNDPLAEMYRVKDARALYRRDWGLLASPWLLAPSTMKILHAQTVSDFWYGLGRAGGMNLGMAIVGYSLPSQDEYAQQVVYEMVTNYQQSWWGKEVLPSMPPKSPVAVVDLQSDESAIEGFRKRYPFMDWTRANEYYSGLDTTSLDLIFA